MELHFHFTAPTYHCEKFAVNWKMTGELFALETGSRSKDLMPEQLRALVERAKGGAPQPGDEEIIQGHGRDGASAYAGAEKIQVGQKGKRMHYPPPSISMLMTTLAPSFRMVLTPS